MNTCKTALRILKSRKMYLVIYLGFIGIMMFAISWQIMRGSMTGGDEVFHPDTARVAVIDRDGDADGISSALRSYLALDGEMVDLADDSEALQQAVASNYVDLIAIVPHGFASDYQKYLDGSSNDQPTVETVVSYTSGAGSLSQLEVNEFLSLTRTAYLGQAGKQQSMETAMRTALDTAKADAKTSKIAVVQSPSADTDNTKPAASAFAGTIKTGLYPLLLVMPICTFLVIGTFNDSEIRRRLYSSPTRLVSLQMQEMLTCAAFGLVVCVGYTAATLVLMVAAGVPFDGITSTNVALTFVSLLAYTLMAIACGFLLGSVGFSEMAVNAFANVFGLLCMFTSGNVAQYTAEKVLEMGGKVLTMSDSDGYIYDPAGIDREKLDYIMELKNLYRGRIREYAEQYPGVKYVEGARPWGEKADIALPSATQNEINGDDAKKLIANGVMAVSEGANMPSTPEAIKVFQKPRF